MWWMESPMDTKNCWIPTSSPLGSRHSIVHLGHICIDYGKSYCGVIRLLLLKFPIQKFACRNWETYAETSMAVHRGRKPFWNILMFFLLCPLILACVPDKGTFLFDETLIWVIFRRTHSPCIVKLLPSLSFPSRYENWTMKVYKDRHN